MLIYDFILKHSLLYQILNIYHILLLQEIRIHLLLVKVRVIAFGSFCHIEGTFFSSFCECFLFHQEDCRTLDVLNAFVIKFLLVFQAYQLLSFSQQLRYIFVALLIDQLVFVDLLLD